MSLVAYFRTFHIFSNWPHCTILPLSWWTYVTMPRALYYGGGGRLINFVVSTFKSCYCAFHRMNNKHVLHRQSYLLTSVLIIISNYFLKCQPIGSHIVFITFLYSRHCQWSRKQATFCLLLLLLASCPPKMPNDRCPEQSGHHSYFVFCSGDTYFLYHILRFLFSFQIFRLCCCCCWCYDSLIYHDDVDIFYEKHVFIYIHT